MAGQRDIDKQLKVVTTIEPAAAKTADVTGTAVDRVGFRSAMVVLHTGVFTDGTFTPTLEHSDSVDSGFEPVAASGLSGAFVAVTAANDQAIQEVGYLGSKRYLRLIMTETVASDGAFMSAVIVLGDPISLPQ